MPRIYVLIGLPGSGKSTAIQNIKHGVIFSSDKMREKLYGDASIQGDPKEVFGKMYDDIRMLLKDNKAVNIILDATNINRKDRRQICELGRQTNSELIAIVMRTPLEVCIERNSKRDRVVPIEAIYKMVSRFEYPLYEEGFSKITVLDYDGKYGGLGEFIEQSKGFDQRNVHHTADLYQHMANAAVYSLQSHKDYALNLAALYHDIGKLFTQTGPDDNGNCHYLGHANWSAYLFLCSTQFNELSCKLINYHMIPYLHEWEKFAKKFAKERFGFIELLEELHEADVNAH